MVNGFVCSGWWVDRSSSVAVVVARGLRLILGVKDCGAYVDIGFFSSCAGVCSG